MNVEEAVRGLHRVHHAVDKAISRTLAKERDEVLDDIVQLNRYDPDASRLDDAIACEAELLLRKRRGQ